MTRDKAIDFVCSFILSVAPVVVGHLLEGKKQEVIHHYRPDDADVSFHAYVLKQRHES
jgi:hypothetical protein